MKTTIDIPDSLLLEVKKIAKQRGTTVKALLESALRQLLKGQQQGPRTFTLRAHTFRGEGLQKGLKEGDWSEILHRSYEGRGG